LKSIDTSWCFGILARSVSLRPPSRDRNFNMKRPLSRATRFFPLLLGVVALTGGCGSGDKARPVVVVDGSSTVFPVSDAVAAQFQRAQPVKVDVKVPIGVSGTRGGFRKFCAGAVDVSGASRPITADEVQLCAKGHVDYVELPIAYDALAVVVNAANSWARDITTEELAKIWQPAAEHTVTRWNQVRPEWPDRELHLYGAGADSGTYDYFTRAIVGTEHSSRSDFFSSEDDDVLVEKLEADPLALGFFGYAYFQKAASKLRALAVDNGRSDDGVGAVSPSADAVRLGTYQPLSRPLFIYVKKSALERREVELFVAYYLQKGATFAQRVGYVPLPETAYVWAQKRAAARTTGSILGAEGSLVGLSIDELMQQEAKDGTRAKGTPNAR
jgi:phosphate transport system substrate-binding protein